MDKHLKVPFTADEAAALRAGDMVYLTGVVYTARDAAHKRMNDALDRGEQLPVDLSGNVVYYLGPTPARPGRVIGSAGPTTASRMDKYAPRLLDLGLRGMIGKGKRTQQVADAIREDTCLVTVMYANNEIGSILPIEEIGAVCREKGVLFHTDAVQAAGHLHINVQEQNIDMLSLSGHKFHGPKGSGVLYARKGIPLVNIIEGGAQERGKRAGTENVPGIAGMAAALEEACAHMEENRVKVTALRDKLIAGLSRIPHSAVNGDLEHRLPGNVNFCFEGIEGESLLLLLDAAGICKMQPWLRQTVSAPYALFERVKLLIAAQAGVLEDAQYGADILVTYRIPAGADEALRTALREASSGTIAPQLLEEIFCAG